MARKSLEDIEKEILNLKQVHAQRKKEAERAKANIRGKRLKTVGGMCEALFGELSEEQMQELLFKLRRDAYAYRELNGIKFVNHFEQRKESIKADEENGIIKNKNHKKAFDKLVEKEKEVNEILSKEQQAFKILETKPSEE